MSFPGPRTSRFTLRATVCLLLIALLAGGRRCIAQQDPASGNEPPPDENATMTLHVYTNLIQIPVLILGPFHDTAPRFDPKQLIVTVGDAKPFHPVHVRPEGDDPIALAILVDVSDTQSRLLPELPSVLEKLARSLHPQDRIAVYALDCTLSRVSDFAPPDAALLKAAGDNARKAATPRTDSHRRNCNNTLRLNDSLVALTDQVWEQTGRRVILAVSRGADTGSIASDEVVHHAATGRGVAIFGISPYVPEVNYVSARRGMSAPITAPPPAPPQRFEVLCEASGGLVRTATQDTLSSMLQLFIRNLRERTIIEFPRPKNTIPGTQIINVTLPNSGAFIRSAGVTVPLPDARTLTDPNTIRPGEDPPPDTAPPPVPDAPQ
jgi:hypothetical protein